MSAPSVRRLSESHSSGGGAKIVAAAPATTAAAVKHRKPLTPQSEKPVIANGRGSSLRKTSDKENPRPTSRSRASTATATVAALTQKPVMRAMPRIDKASAVNGSLTSSGGSEIRAEGRARWSTIPAMAPMQRGRSASPSEFNRVSLNTRTSRASSVEKKRQNMRVSSEKSEIEKLGSRTSAKSSEIRDKKAVNLSSGSVKFNLDDSDEKPSLSGSEKLKSSSRSDSKNVKGVSSSLNGKDGNEDKSSGSSGVKYPSKVHEKLAFLEGKVKRIASDIKKTKEMLDMNNPDSSKLILSDIQEKISGIEKAMYNDVSIEDNKGGKGCENDDEKIKALEVREESQVNEGQSLVNGLNADELEARLFPHHKLIRDRTSLKSFFENAQISEAETAGTDGKFHIEEKAVNLVDEHPVALEFLASLGNDQFVDTTRGRAVSSEFGDVQETDESVTSEKDSVSNRFAGKGPSDAALTADERIEEFDSQENTTNMIIGEETEDSFLYTINEIGRKTTTGGWFVSEGESVLLAHDDGSCSFHDIVNCEQKAIYKPPSGVSPNMWRDCWLMRAPDADGCSGRYVVAASAGNSIVSGFCSWEMYSKDVRAFHIDNGTSITRTALAPLPNHPTFRRNVSTSTDIENPQWWYRPCGTLIASLASSQRFVRFYDVRDGEDIMKLELQKPISGMDYSCPLQWRNKGKVVVAESEMISVWDVNSTQPEALSSVSSSNRKIVALHVNNTDAELGGGVRQRVSSSEEGNDGVFCTSDSIHVLDFRHPSGIGLKIPKVGIDVHSAFSRGDSVYLGCTNLRSSGKKQYSSQVLQFSLRTQRLYSTYAIPDSNAHSHFTHITQVWGNSNSVMGVSGQGLFVFDAFKDEVMMALNPDSANLQKTKEVIGPDDMYCPSFDYAGSRVLVVSRDRPALWRYLI